MSDNFTDTPFTCGDGPALVSYLYDECQPAERDAIEAHLAVCLACAEEIAGLDATRRMLPAWTPPQASLGFQVTTADAPAQVLRPARWWQRPLPAWAQAAAAAVIFAAGLAAGRLPGAGPANVPSRDGATAAAVRPAASAPEAQAATAASQASEGASVSPADVARLEAELRARIDRLEQADALRSDLVRAPARAADAIPEDQRITLDRVEALILESERRQRGELLWGMEQVLSDVDLQRRRLDAVQTTVEGLGKDTWSNRQSVSALANVFSTQSGFRPVSSR